MAAIAKKYAGQEASDRIYDLVDKSAGIDDLQQAADVNRIWEYRAMQSLANYLAPSNTTVKGNEARTKRSQQLNWRLAELDPDRGSSYLRGMLISRVRVNSGSSAEDTEDPNAQELLTEKQVDLLMSLYQKSLADMKSGNQSNVSLIAPMQYQVILHDHFTRAGDQRRAKEYEIQPPGDEATLEQIISSMSMLLTLGKVAEADKLVDRLMPAVRNDRRGRALSTSSVSGITGGLLSASTDSQQFIARHRVKLMQAAVARAISANDVPRRKTTALSSGSDYVYVKSSRNSYYSIQVKAPLSTYLLPKQVMIEFTSLLPSNGSNDYPRSLNLSKDMLRHLDDHPPDAPPIEIKIRAVLAAFACWWDQRPEDCYSRLVELSERFPDDIDLRIERARLASLVDHPRVALQALDAFDPLDSRMLVRKEMAALNLATEISDDKRAKQAAERLFGLRMDTKMHLAVANQMRRLGMPDKADAVLRRLRGGRRHDTSTELSIANAFVQSQDQDAAAEVAYSVLKRLSSGRSTERNAASYRSRAVTILKNAGRLDPLIQQAQRRVEQSPKSVRAKTHLAELYAAAGKKNEANQLWSEIYQQKPADPRRLASQAQTLYRSQNYKQAAPMYLEALKRNPALFNQYGYEMIRAFDRAKDTDALFRGLITIDPNRIPAHRIDYMIRTGRNTAYTDVKRKFITHILANQDVRQNFYRYIDDIPSKEREKIPAIRKMIIEVICSDEAYGASSSLWHVSSRSSGGTANGPLKEIIELLLRDDEALQRFLKASESTLEDTNKKPTADLVRALLNVCRDESVDESVQSIRKIANRTIAASKQGVEKPISEGLLWQAGQILETYDKTKDNTELLVAIYRASASYSQSSLSDLRFSVGARLVNALIRNNEQAEARRFMIDAYLKTDHSDQNAYNPGYGDYQEITAYDSIADLLDKAGFTIDAWLIQQGLIAHPERYSKANRWNSGLRVSSAIKKADTLLSKTNAETSRTYLKAVMSEAAQTDRPNAIRLIEFPIDVVLASGMKPGLQIALELVAKDDQGQADIDQFVSQLKSQATKRPDDWSIPAAVLLASICADSNQMGAALEALKARLPDEDTINSLYQDQGLEAVEPLVGLVTLLSACQSNPSAETDAVFAFLRPYLNQLADRLQDSSVMLAFAAVNLSDESAIMTWLDAQHAYLDEGNYSRTQIEQHLSFASIMARNGMVKLSTKALTIALGNGPPGKVSRNLDPFALSQNASTSNQPANPLESLGERLRAIIDQYSDLLGVQLGFREPNKSGRSDMTPEALKKSWQELDVCLQGIVMPANRPTNVYPYARRIATRTNYDNYSSSDNLMPASVAIAMARVAAKTGSSDKILKQLQQRFDQAADRKEVALVMLNVALAWGDHKAITASIERFYQVIDPVLPKQSPQNNATGTISSQTQQESYQKSDLIDLLVRVIAPLVKHESISEIDPNDRLADLLKRTRFLIDSDSYTSSRHREIKRRIEQHAGNFGVSLPERSDNPFATPTTAPSPIRSVFPIRLGRSTPAATSSASGLSGREALLMRLITDGMFSQTVRVQRQIIATRKRPVFSSKINTSIITAAAQLASKERLDVLKKLTLGTKQGEPILHLTAYVGDDHEAGSSAESADGHEEKSVLPTVTKTLKIANTVAMLADVAAEQGQSEQIASEIKSYSKNAGDAADVAAAIVMLAEQPATEQTTELVANLLKAIQSNLQSKSPSKPDSSIVFADLTLCLTARLIASGTPTEELKPILDQLRLQAEFGDYKAMIPVLDAISTSG